MSNNGKNKRWTSKDIAFVRQHLGKVSLEDMAFALRRSPMSVRLYILRNRLTPSGIVRRNLLLEMLKIKL